MLFVWDCRGRFLSGGKEVQGERTVPYVVPTYPRDPRSRTRMNRQARRCPCRTPPRTP